MAWYSWLFLKKPKAVPAPQPQPQPALAHQHTWVTTAAQPGTYVVTNVMQVCECGECRGQAYPGTWTLEQFQSPRKPDELERLIRGK